LRTVRRGGLVSIRLDNGTKGHDLTALGGGKEKTACRWGNRRPRFWKGSTAVHYYKDGLEISLFAFGEDVEFKSCDEPRSGGTG